MTRREGRAETEAFRAEFGAWLDTNAPDPSTIDVPSKSSADAPQWARDWQRKLFEAGWLVPGNPPEYGGRNGDVAVVATLARLASSDSH